MQLGTKPTTKCVEWSGCKRPGDYGQISIRGTNWFAHRLVWRIYNGPIPEGLCICHSCDNPGCVNIDHLFLGTYSDNLKDSYKKGRKVNQHSLKTHCENGHPFIPENLGNHKNGKRVCKICHRKASKDYRERKAKGIVKAVGRPKINPPKVKKFPKTHCKNGHTYSGTNLYIRPSGIRSCRMCHKNSEIKRRQRMKENE